MATISWSGVAVASLRWGINSLFNSLKACTGPASLTYATCLVLYLNPDPNRHL